MDSGLNQTPTETTVELPLSLLEPNPWNPNRMGPENYARLKRELGCGFLAPLLVRPRGDRFQIVDGEHRYRLALELGRASVPCVVAQLSDREARLKTLQMNGLRGENDPDLLGRLLAELRAELDPQKLAALLPWSADEIEAMTKLAVRDAGDVAKKIAAGFRMPPVTVEFFALVVPLGGRAEIESAVALAREREGAADDGAALVALCRKYQGRETSPPRRGGAEEERPGA